MRSGRSFAGSLRYIRIVERAMEPGKEYTTQQIEYNMRQLLGTTGRPYQRLPKRHQLVNILGRAPQFEKVGFIHTLSAALWRLNAE